MGIRNGRGLNGTCLLNVLCTALSTNGKGSRKRWVVLETEVLYVVARDEETILDI